MSKHGKEKATKTKTILILFVEGDTEVEFYKKLVSLLRKKSGQASCHIEIKNVKGIDNYQNKVCRIFEKRIKIDYPDYKYIIALCYDTDVFEYSRKPSVDWNKVTKLLKEKGADQIQQVCANKSIEDWFLLDKDGLRKFLNIPTNVKISGYQGQKGIVKLFKSANKTYAKGTPCKGLIDSLNIENFFPVSCKMKSDT